MRILWLMAGHLSVLFGLIGIFLPILPTTPLIILAAFFYSKGSERFENMILEHRRIGPLVREWRERRVIRRKVKWQATLAIIVTASIPIFILDVPVWARASVCITIGAVLVFIWTRHEN